MTCSVQHMERNPVKFRSPSPPPAGCTSGTALHPAAGAARRPPKPARFLGGNTVDGQNPFRTTQDTMLETSKFLGIYRGSYHSRVS